MTSASQNGSGQSAMALHQGMVDRLREAGRFTSARIEAAFRAIPRHLFVPQTPLDQVYTDDAIVTKRADGQPISSSSQPSMMAIMLGQLDPQPGERVLEIGAGTGYNAALLAYLVGVTGEVVTVDIDQDIIDEARAHLDAAGFQRVRTVCADGGEGYAPRAPYDRIMLTVGAWDVTPAWREQLACGGRLVLPLSLRGVQRSIAFERAEECLESVSVYDCGFMRLRGAFAGPEQRLPLTPTGDVQLWLPEQSAGAGAATTWLAGERTEVSAGVELIRGEAFRRLALWLALHDPGSCAVMTVDSVARRRGLVVLFGFGEDRQALASLSEDGLCLLGFHDADTPWTAVQEDPAPREPIIQVFGAREAGERLRDRLVAWDRAGRPGTDGLHVRACPIGSDLRASAHDLVIDKRWSRLLLTWDAP